MRRQDHVGPSLCIASGQRDSASSAGLLRRPSLKQAGKARIEMMPFKIFQPSREPAPGQDTITLGEYFRQLAERDREGIEVLKAQAVERETKRVAAKPRSTRRKPPARKP